MAKRVTPCTSPGEDACQDDSRSAEAQSRVGRLDTVDRVRREAVRLYKDCRRGVLAPADASRLAHVLDLVRRLVEAGDIERRLDELEAAVRHGTSPDDPSLAIARQLRAERAAA